MGGRSVTCFGFALASAAVLGSAPSASAQSSPWSLAKALDAPPELKLSGSARVRYEYIDNAVAPGFDPSDNLVTLRTTLFAEYDTGPVRFGAELFDSRAYAADPGTPLTSNEVNALELVQAYAAVDIAEPFGKGTSATVQAGRFAISIGSRRLITNEDYRNTTNGFTGLRVDLSPGGGVQALLLYTLPQLRLPDDRASLFANRVAFDRESFALVFWGGVLTKALDKRTSVDASFFHLGERDSPDRATRDRSLNTVSARVIHNPAPRRWDYELEGYYQFGRASPGTLATARRFEVAAWSVHAEAGYTFRHTWRPHVSLEFDTASGETTGGKITRFDALFGSRRGDLGPSGIYGIVGRANIVTPGLRLEVTPNKRTDGFVSYRPVWLASRTDRFSTTAVRDAAGRSGSFAGQQVEARVRHWLVRDALRFEASGALLFKGRFLKSAPNAPATGDTKYLSLNLSATF